VAGVPGHDSSQHETPPADARGIPSATRLRAAESVGSKWRSTPLRGLTPLRSLIATRSGYRRWLMERS